MGGKGFLQETITAQFKQPGRLAVDAVAAGEQYTDCRIDFFQGNEGVKAAQPRHDHIQNDQIDAHVVLLVEIDGLTAAVGREYGVAEYLQHFLSDFQDGGVIVHEQDGFRAALLRFVCRIHGRLARCEGR